jgi:hypothetical protein
MLHNGKQKSSIFKVGMVRAIYIASLTYGDFLMYKEHAQKALNTAMRHFKATPSAKHYRALCDAMLAYQEACTLEGAL